MAKSNREAAQTVVMVMVTKYRLATHCFAAGAFTILSLPAQEQRPVSTFCHRPKACVVSGGTQITASAQAPSKLISSIDIFKGLPTFVSQLWSRPSKVAT